MVVLKPDTSRGFRPRVPGGPDVRALGRATLRLDARLEESLLGPSLHELLLSMARMRNVVSSLRIEGERIDLEGARRALEQGAGATPAEVQVVRVAREYSRIHETPSGRMPTFTVETILELHRRCFEGIHEEANPGVLKTQRNGVVDLATGQWVFEATPPRRTRAELERLFEWWEAQRDMGPAVSVAAVLFAEFQAIHPFHDGNGRVGRLLGAMALKRLGYENVVLAPLDGRFWRTQDQYYDKLRSTNAGREYAPWARYFGKQLASAYGIAVRRANIKPLLERQTRPATRSLLEWVLARDATPFAFRDYPNPRRLSRASVQKSLGQLVEQGILAASGERKGRRYRLTTPFLRRLYAGDITE